LATSIDINKTIQEKGHSSFHNDNKSSSTGYNATVSKYVRNVSTMNISTANEYLARLNNFKIFIAKEYGGLTVDGLVARIKEGSLDPYEVLVAVVLTMSKNNHNKGEPDSCKNRY
jgi:hypothetical protein